MGVFRMRGVSLNDTYSLLGGKYIESLATVDNIFIRQVANLAKVQANNLKYVSFVMKDKVNDRGEISYRNVRPDMKSVLDICKLVPLVNNNVKNLREEIALYHADFLGLGNSTIWAYNNQEMLMVDYLLTSSLCYVEVFDGTSHVDKFFATRNRFIAGMVTGKSEEETRDYTTYLRTDATNYETRQLKALKIAASNSGFRISRPRSSIDFENCNVKVTPLFLMASFYSGLEQALQDKILKIKYIKDNFVEREFITTLNIPTLNQMYDNDTVQRLISNVQVMLYRGYVRLPELGLSKYDETGVRALNISRITSVEQIGYEEVDKSYVNVDFNRIMNTFRETIYAIKDFRVLATLYEQLLGTIVPPEIVKSQYAVAELRTAILTFADSQVAIGTTMALRQFHNFMVSRENIFTTYHGGTPIKDTTTDMNVFNLGLSAGGNTTSGGTLGVQPSEFQRQQEVQKAVPEDAVRGTNVDKRFGVKKFEALGTADEETNNSNEPEFFNPFL